VAEFAGNHSRWEIGQPDNVNNSQHCVSLKLNYTKKYFAMHDNRCSQKFKLVCQVLETYKVERRIITLHYFCVYSGSYNKSTMRSEKLLARLRKKRIQKISFLEILLV